MLSGLINSNNEENRYYAAYSVQNESVKSQLFIFKNGKGNKLTFITKTAKIREFFTDFINLFVN